MDELGYLKPPGPRLGYLDAQLLRAVRVVSTSACTWARPCGDPPVGACETWTPELASEFFRATAARSRRSSPARSSGT